jgi:hypothetical protein
VAYFQEEALYRQAVWKRSLQRIVYTSNLTSLRYRENVSLFSMLKKS